MKKNINKKRLKNGFSLMELMVVIIILALLAALVLPNLITKSDEAKEKLACIQMKTISQVLKMYKLNNSAYPTTAEGLELLVKNKYFQDNKIPKDSWNNEFIYLLKDKDSYELISKGSDKKENTSDDIYLSKCNK